MHWMDVFDRWNCVLFDRYGVSRMARHKRRAQDKIASFFFFWDAQRQIAALFLDIT